MGKCIDAENGYTGRRRLAGGCKDGCMDHEDMSSLLALGTEYLGRFWNLTAGGPGYTRQASGPDEGM